MLKLIALAALAALGGTTSQNSTKPAGTINPLTGATNLHMAAYHGNKQLIEDLRIGGRTCA